MRSAADAAAEPAAERIEAPVVPVCLLGVMLGRCESVAAAVARRALFDLSQQLAADERLVGRGWAPDPLLGRADEGAAGSLVVAAPVLFLGSPANGNITGAYLPSGGGTDYFPRTVEDPDSARRGQQRRPGLNRSWTVCKARCSWGRVDAPRVSGGLCRPSPETERRDDRSADLRRRSGDRANLSAVR